MPNGRSPVPQVMLLVGGLVVAYVGLTFLVGGVVNVRRNLAFDREGVPVDAVILRTEARSRPSRPGGYGSGGSTMRVVYYRYRAPDGVHEGSANPPREVGAKLGAGDTIKVTYLPSQPGESRFGGSSSFPALLVCAGAVLSLVGIGLIVKGASYFRRAGQQASE